MNYDEIEKKALQTLEDIGYKDETDEVDIIKVANLLGIQVGNASLDDAMDGFIIINEGNNKILGVPTDKLIGVNSDRTLQWKRFIIAHEIGHYKMHYSGEGMYAHRDHVNGKNEKENEADFFAANILMPRSKFTDRYKELSNKGLGKQEIVVLMADKFMVTHRMAERRVEELRLI